VGRRTAPDQSLVYIAVAFRGKAKEHGSMIRVFLGRIKRLMPGYDYRNWLRVAQIDAWTKFLSANSSADVLEISPGWNEYWKKLRFKSYRSVEFPEFDICSQILPDQTFDIILADQVFEHLPKPISAGANIHRMLRPGGYALIASPFLFRVHGRPNDYTRWTAEGMRQLLIVSGFKDSLIDTSSWGNKACAKAHIGGHIRDFGLSRDMSNDPEYPMMVWAIAQRE